MNVPESACSCCRFAIFPGDNVTVIEYDDGTQEVLCNACAEQVELTITPEAA